MEGAHSQGEFPRHTGLRDRIFAIRMFEELRGLDEDGFVLLAEHARDLTFPGGSVLSREGEPGRFIHLVLEGRIRLSRKGKTLAVVERGHSVGLLTALAQKPLAHAVAEIDTRTLEIPIQVFVAALEENFSLLRTSLRLACAAVVRIRGKLPADPSTHVAEEMGEYYERPATLVERILAERPQNASDTAVNVEFLVALARRTIELRVPEGYVFWSLGDRASFGLRIGYGRVRCTSDDGRHVVVGKDFRLGTLDAWCDQPRSYEARAETRVIAYKTGVEDFAAMMENHLDVGFAFLSLMGRVLDSSQGGI